MKICKESQGGSRVAPSQEDLTRISALARKEMTAEEVYTFSVRLCDNEIDRDLERFAPQTLEELAGLFVGKSGIFDHQWSARGQAARIYRTEVIRESALTRAGDPYCWLKGYAYMVRTDATRDLIAEIEGGIKKEVSVGCAVERAVCSVCGKDLRRESCGHKKGEVYDGQLCYVSLEGANDAYEFSFVAVPAQPRAGVVKGRGPGLMRLKDLAAGDGELEGELKLLEEEARLGRDYLERLRAEVVRLGMLADLGLERSVLESMAEKMDCGQLRSAGEAYGRRAGERYPIRTQLNYGRQERRAEADGAFLI